MTVKTAARLAAPREFMPESPAVPAPPSAASQPGPQPAPPAAPSWLHGLAWLTRRFQPKGIDRLVRLIYPPGSTRAIETVVDYDDGLLMHIDTRSFLEWYIFFYGHFRPEVSKLLNRMLKPGHVAFDIGSNIGMHSIVMANRVGPTGKVVVFEPDPHPYARMRRNLALNGFDWVETHQVALAEKSGRMQLFLHDDTIGNFANASLSVDNVGRETNAIEIDVWSIDDYVARNPIARLDAIKLLAQGVEWDVLQGARATIAKFRPKIFFLWEPSYWARKALTLADARAFFASFGYDVHVVEFGPRRIVRGEVALGQVLLAVP
jgi:FkbM family methyltransferase